MLRESQKVTLIGLLNETKTWENKTWIKILAAVIFYQIQPRTQIRLWLYVPVIFCLSQVFTRQKNTSARQPSLSDTQLKVHQIHKSIEIQTSYLCHILYYLVLEHFALRLVSKLAHLDNKGFPPVFFESLCVWAFLDTFSVYHTPKYGLWKG